MTTREPIGDLGDRAAVEQVLLRYVTALDGRDWPSLGSCFHEDAVATYRDAIARRGREAIVGYCRDGVAPFVTTHHQLTNIDLRVDGDTATSSCTVRAEHLLARDGGDEVYVVMGRYRDRLQRTTSGWQLIERHLDASWTATYAATGS